MSKQRRLAVVLAINLAMIGGLLAAGIVAHSLGVIAAGADYLGDALGTGLSLAALRLAERGRTGPRATTLAALVNCTLLAVVTAIVAVAAVLRLLEGAPEVRGGIVLVVSAVAAVAMVACALVLGDVGGDVNLQSVMLDSVADAAAAAGVAISGAVMLAVAGAYWLDPAVALTIAIVVGWQALVLMRRILAELRGARPQVHERS